MSIAAPNYTQSPNVIFDYWMSRLTGTEFKVLCVLCRKIFGFHKERMRDCISLSQMENITGQNRQSLWKAVQKLIDLGLCRKFVCGTKGQEATVYELVVSNNSDQDDFHPGSTNFKTQILETKPEIQKSLTRVKITPTKESSKEKSSPQPPMGGRAELPKRESLSFEDYHPEAQAYAMGSLKAIRRRGVKIRDEAAFLRKQAAKWVKPSAEPTPRKSWPVKNNFTNQQEIIKEVKELCRIAGVYCSESRDDLLVGFDGNEYSAFKCQEALFEKVFNNCIRMLYEKISRAT